jgi:hypothetical protein
MLAHDRPAAMVAHNHAATGRAAMIAHDHAATGRAAMVAHDHAATTAAAAAMIADCSPAAVRARGCDAREQEKHDADGSEVATHDLNLTGSGAAMCLEFKAM